MTHIRGVQYSKSKSLSLSKQVGIFLSCSKCYFEIKHFFYVLFPYDESKYLVSTSFSSFAHFHSISGLKGTGL